MGNVHSTQMNQAGQAAIFQCGGCECLRHTSPRGMDHLAGSPGRHFPFLSHDALGEGPKVQFAKGNRFLPQVPSEQLRRVEKGGLWLVTALLFKMPPPPL